MKRRLAALAAACASLLVAGGCLGGDDDGGDPSRADRTDRPTAPAPSAPAEGRERDTAPRAGRLEPARCPPDLSNCRTASGRIVYVERVDPDGDGDAHFVLRDPQGITLPGLTAIDVRKGLRPDPLPGPGDLLSAAGPVQTGSYGQRQIHALVLRVGS